MRAKQISRKIGHQPHRKPGNDHIVPAKTSRLATLLLLPPILAAGADKITFDDHVFPVFEQSCLNCHNPDKAKGGLDLSTFGATLKGGSGGKIVDAGDTSAKLIAVMTHSAEPKMPPEGDKVAPDKIALLKQWIEGGLLENKSSSARKPTKPKFDVAMGGGNPTAKPEGPPPMPEHLLLEPVVAASRGTAVRSLAASPWAPLLATTSQQQVLLYDTDNLRLAAVLPFPAGDPVSLSFTPDGRYLIAGGGIAGKSGTTVTWDVKTGELMLQVAKEFDSVLAADLRPGLRRRRHRRPVAPPQALEQRRWRNGRLDQEAHRLDHRARLFTPDGVLLATGDRNGGVWAWEAQAGAEFHTLRAHQARITGLAFRADSNVLASASEDGSGPLLGNERRQRDPEGRRPPRRRARLLVGPRRLLRHHRPRPEHQDLEAGLRPQEGRSSTTPRCPPPSPSPPMAPRSSSATTTARSASGTPPGARALGSTSLQPAHHLQPPRRWLQERIRSPTPRPSPPPRPALAEANKKLDAARKQLAGCRGRRQAESRKPTSRPAARRTSGRSASKPSTPRSPNSTGRPKRSLPAATRRRPRSSASRPLPGPELEKAKKQQAAEARKATRRHQPGTRQEPRRAPAAARQAGRRHQGRRGGPERDRPRPQRRRPEAQGRRTAAEQAVAAATKALESRPRAGSPPSQQEQHFWQAAAVNADAIRKTRRSRPTRLRFFDIRAADYAAAANEVEQRRAAIQSNSPPAAAPSPTPSPPRPTTPDLAAEIASVLDTLDFRLAEGPRRLSPTPPAHWSPSAARSTKPPRPASPPTPRPASLAARYRSLIAGLDQPNPPHAPGK
jgi:hypothetical protein